MDELQMLRDQEKAEKMQSLKNLSARHSRFVGTYVLKNMKSISDQPIVYHRSLNNLSNLDFNAGKKRRKIAKNRKPNIEEPYTRRSTLSVRTFLKEFCVKLVDNSYNQLMKSVKSILNRSTTDENDETYYLWAMRFFMEFSRLYQFRVDVISETFQLSTFHYIQTQMYKYDEMIMMEKSQAIRWSSRLHLALSVYRELLLTLNAMSSCSIEEIRENAKILKSNIFYQPEYRDIVLSLFKSFNESRNSRAYLRELIETTHLFLKMLEQFTRGQNRMVVKRSAKRPKKKKKPKKPAAKVAEPVELTDEQLEDNWMEIADDLSGLIRQGDSIELPSAEVLVFDPTSDKDTEGQKIDAMVTIQEFLFAKDCRKALACFRAGRSIWPENDTFGHADILEEEEFLSLREIFMAKLPRRQTNPDPVPDESESEEEEEEEVLAHVETREQEFSFKDFVLNFIHVKVLQCVTIALGDFKKNSTAVNHAAVKLLHRIAFDCELPSFTFQASLFLVLQKILHSPPTLKQYDELRTFAKYIVRQFAKLWGTNKKLCAELMFLKSRREAFEIANGYGSYQQVEHKGGWTADEQEELDRLFQLYEKKDTDPPDQVVAFIEENISAQKTRKKIVNQLIRQGLIENRQQVSKPPKTPWDDQDDDILREEFEKYQQGGNEPDGPDCIDRIRERLTTKVSRRRIINRMVAISLIENPTEFHKSKKPSNPVLEEEVERLRELFEMYKDHEEPLKFIKRGMVIKHSTDDIREKLFELGLIQTRDELTRKRHAADSSSSEEEYEIEEEVKIPFTEEEILEQLSVEDFKEAVSWLSILLGEVAADREKEVDLEEAIPIVPILDFQLEALDNEYFTALLTRIGIRSPNDQENYWRIPVSLSVADLNLRAEVLSKRDLEALKGLSKPKQMVKQLRPKVKKPKKKQKPLKLIAAGDDDVESVSSNEPEWQTGRHKETVEQAPTTSRVERAAASDSSASTSSFSSGSEFEDGKNSDGSSGSGKVKKKRNKPTVRKRSKATARADISSDSESETEGIQGEIENEFFSEQLQSFGVDEDAVVEKEQPKRPQRKPTRRRVRQSKRAPSAPSNDEDSLARDGEPRGDESLDADADSAEDRHQNDVAAKTLDDAATSKSSCKKRVATALDSDSDGESDERSDNIENEEHLKTSFGHQNGLAEALDDAATSKSRKKRVAAALYSDSDLESDDHPENPENHLKTSSGHQNDVAESLDTVTSKSSRKKRVAAALDSDSDAESDDHSENPENTVADEHLKTSSGQKPRPTSIDSDIDDEDSKSDDVAFEHDTDNRKRMLDSDEEESGHKLKRKRVVMSDSD